MPVAVLAPLLTGQRDSVSSVAAVMAAKPPPVQEKEAIWGSGAASSSSAPAEASKKGPSESLGLIVGHRAGVALDVVDVNWVLTQRHTHERV